MADGIREPSAFCSDVSRCSVGNKPCGYTNSIGAGTPRATAANLGVVGQEVESSLVAERDVNNAVVGECAHGGDSSALLSTTLGSGADEQAGVLAPVATSLPLTAGLVPESPPLGGEVAVAGRDTEKEGVVLLESGRVAEHGDLAGGSGSVHHGEDFLGEGLLDAVEVTSTAGGLDTLGLSLGQGLDVAIHGVLEEVGQYVIALSPNGFHRMSEYC